MQRRMQQKRAVGHECVSVICEATSHPCYWWLCRSWLTCHAHNHTCFAFFIAFFPMDVSAKERLLTIYWGHQDQQCLAALLSWSLGASRRTILSRGHFRTVDLNFKITPSLSLSCLILLPGCHQGANRFLQLVHVQCLQLQSNTFTCTFAVIAFSHIAI